MDVIGPLLHVLLYVPLLLAYGVITAATLLVAAALAALLTYRRS